jgi:hypothetical protein
MCEIACVRHADLVKANHILYYYIQGQRLNIPSHHFLVVVVSTTVPLMLIACQKLFELLSPVCHVAVRDWDGSCASDLTDS